ncbi:DNA polymerase [anatid alphaherpesvirus 1]|uniref:DNA polymerase n=7 Tax=anatid alphaherpesvirus 1 TaxID=104388 RepID=A2TIW3_9ALPH|nr:UL30 [Anatid alphaherpesvirus 1]YP_010795345.1 DNA polymerase [Anatid alphaherpesvirus 1]AHD45951.1 UL30 [BAC cloning vector pDEV-vac]ABM92130.1 DNA polymerase [Anatid alphaherpesvirus 1]ABO26217.1 UL30-like [Anatid alphaherpesvirus 1]ABU46133.1 UL30 protein [Anatid alphaherpesvirus 1]ACT83543.1 UL30 [Anatid alphaherpesvirus 1]
MAESGRNFFNPYLDGSAGRGNRKGPVRGNRYSYYTDISEFKFIAPRSLDEEAEDSKRKGTNIGVLRRKPIAYCNGATFEFLNYDQCMELWTQRTHVWGERSFLANDFNPRFARFHVYDMVEYVETISSSSGRDAERFVKLLSPMGTIVTMLGLSECGKKVAVHVYGICQYFYMKKSETDAACGSRCPRDLAEHMATALRSSSCGGSDGHSGEFSSAGKGGRNFGYRNASPECFEIDIVERCDIYYFDTTPCEFYRIKARSSRHVSFLSENFLPNVTKYESNVDATTRLILDNIGFSTFGWYRLKIGNNGERIQVRAPEHHTTSCDVEINCTVDNLVGDSEDGAIPDYKLLCFDIECKSGGQNELAFPVASNEDDLVIQISCILYSLSTRCMEHALLFSLGSCDLPEIELNGKDGAAIKPEVLEFDSEYELLLCFLTFLKQYSPEFVSGYNIVNFDWAFLYNKLTTVYGIKLDGYGAMNKGGMFRVWELGGGHFQKRSKVKINGIISLDMYSVATEKLKLSSYKLETVASAALGEHKRDLSYKDIPVYYASGPSKRGLIGEYCIQDSVLVGKLFFKYLPHLELSAVAKLAGILLPRVVFDGQQVRVYTCLLRLAGQHGFVLPENKSRFSGKGGDSEHLAPALQAEDLEDSDEDEEKDETDNTKMTSGSAMKGGRSVGYRGAKVLDPCTGFHVDPVTVFDFASLYPSIIQAHNLCFTTLTLKEEAVSHLNADDYLDITVAGQRLFFVKPHIRVSLLSVLLRDWLAMRKAIRAKIPTSTEEQALLLDKQQLAIKVVCNSVYGFCGVSNGLLPCLHVAATVTTVGRNMLLSVRDYIHTHWTTCDMLVQAFPELVDHVKDKQAYSAMVIYGDTDSVFVRIKGIAPEGLVAVGDAMASMITRELFTSPIKLECEKTFFRLLLITKKKYIGTIVGGKMMMKGVDLVRKNNCKFINYYAKRLVDLLFGNDEVAAAAAAISKEPAKTWLERSLPPGLGEFGATLAEAYSKIRARELNVPDFVMTAELSRAPEAYVNKRIPHLTVYYKLCMREEQPPAIKERIPYVIVAQIPSVERDAERVATMRGDKRPSNSTGKADGPAAKRRKLLVSELAEDPGYVLANHIPLNTDYYFSHLLGTLSVTFKALFGNDHKTSEAVLKRFIPETYCESDETAALLSSAGFAEVRLYPGMPLSEEEENRQKLRRAFDILAEVPHRN